MECPVGASRQPTTKENQMRRVAGFFLSFTLLAVSACGIMDDLLEVEARSRVVADDLFSDPTNAPILLDGVVGDFDCAFTHYTAAGGLLGDELIVADASSGT